MGEDHAIEILELERLKLREHIRVIRRVEAEACAGPYPLVQERQLKQIEDALNSLCDTSPRDF